MAYYRANAKQEGGIGENWKVYDLTLSSEVSNFELPMARDVKRGRLTLTVPSSVAKHEIAFVIPYINSTLRYRGVSVSSAISGTVVYELTFFDNLASSGREAGFTVHVLSQYSGGRAASGYAYAETKLPDGGLVMQGSSGAKFPAGTVAHLEYV